MHLKDSQMETVFLTEEMEMPTHASVKAILNGQQKTVWTLLSEATEHHIFIWSLVIEGATIKGIAIYNVIWAHLNKMFPLMYFLDTAERLRQ